MFTRRKGRRGSDVIHPPVLILTPTATQGFLGDIVFVKASGEYWEILDWVVTQPYDAWFINQTKQKQIDVPLRRIGVYEITCTAHNPGTGLRVTETVTIHCLQDNFDQMFKKLERLDERLTNALEIIVKLDARITELEKRNDGTTAGL